MLPLKGGRAQAQASASLSHERLRHIEDLLETNVTLFRIPACVNRQSRYKNFTHSWHYRFGKEPGLDSDAAW